MCKWRGGGGFTHHFLHSLVDMSWHVRLCDFSHSLYVKGGAVGVCALGTFCVCASLVTPAQAKAWGQVGSLEVTAPEVFLKRERTKASGSFCRFAEHVVLPHRAHESQMSIRTAFCCGKCWRMARRRLCNTLPTLWRSRCLSHRPSSERLRANSSAAFT